MRTVVSRCDELKWGRKGQLLFRYCVEVDVLDKGLGSVPLSEDYGADFKRERISDDRLEFDGIDQGFS